MSDIRTKYGKHIPLGKVVLGKNLNLWVIRGFAPMDLLAEISSADVYDEFKNPQGTQRDLTKSHSQDALNYALESENVSSQADPRAFPEIILNARDADLIELSSDDKSHFPFDFDSLEGVEDFDGVVLNLRIKTENFIWPKPAYSPQISRVDGNHRLFQAEIFEEYDEDGNEFLPSIPFSMFVGLSPIQERKLFKDINANQKGMESAFLDTIVHSQSDELTLLSDPKTRALVIAKRLTQPGFAFEGKVFTGGSRKGAKEKFGEVPPIKLNALKRAVQTTLKKADRFTADQFPSGVELGQEMELSQKRKLQAGVDATTQILDRYWKAVSYAYPEAWQNRKDYILLQSIGLEGFSLLASRIIENLVYELRKWEQTDFSGVLQKLSQNFSLDKSDFVGIAGAAGASEVCLRATKKLSPDGQIIAVLNQSLGINSVPSEID